MLMLNKLKFFTLALSFVLSMGVSGFAQDGTPRKFDEFIGELDDEDMMARLDNFSIALVNQSNAQGHIIVYRSRRDPSDISREHARRAKDYLVKVRHIDPNRLVTVDAGMLGCLMYELWIVPPGASPPERRFTYKYPLKRYNRR